MLTGSLDTPSTNARPSQSNFEARAAHYSAIYNYYPKKRQRDMANAYAPY